MSDNSLPQTVARFVEEAISKLREAESELRAHGKMRAADALASVITRAEVTRSAHLVDLAGVPRSKYELRNRLEPVFYAAWRRRYPRYGDPSPQDRKEVREMFNSFIAPVFPGATGELIDELVENFARSTADWVRKSREIHTLARNARKFMSGPLADEDSPRQTVRLDTEDIHRGLAIGEKR